MTHVEIRNNTNTSVRVASNKDVATALYNIALTTEDISLVGNIQLDYSYKKPVEYLNNQFSSTFHITVTDGYYVDFGDSAFLAAIASIVGSAGDVTEAQAASINYNLSHLSNYNLSISNPTNYKLIFQNNDIKRLDFTSLTGIRGMAWAKGQNNVDMSSVEYMNIANVTLLGAMPNKVPDVDAYTGSPFTYSFATKNTLKELVLPDVKNINIQAMFNCPAKELYCPNIEHVANYSFRNDPNLYLIYFGSKLKRIGCNIFNDNNNPVQFASSINVVISATTPPQMFSDTVVSDNGYSKDSQSYDSVTFEDGTPNPSDAREWGRVSIYVPDDTLDEYKAANGWSTLASKIHPISELSSTYKAAIKANTGITL